MLAKTTSAAKQYTTGEVAVLVGCAPRTVTGWIDSGRLKGYRLPPRRTGVGDRRVYRAELIRFLRHTGMTGPLADLGVSNRIVVIGVEDGPLAALATAAPGFVVVDAGNAFRVGRELDIGAAVVVIDLSMGRRAVEAVSAEVADLKPVPPVIYLSYRETMAHEIPAGGTVCEQPWTDLPKIVMEFLK